jgi:cytosine/adenosine deaminase-related metal-dependent hydrolase
MRGAEKNSTHWILAHQAALPGAGDALRVTSALLGVQGGRLIAVVPDVGPGSLGRHVGPHDTCEVLGERLLVTPAFVDAHTHLAMACFRALPTDGVGAKNMVEDIFYRVEKLLEPADVRAFARMGAWEAMLNGVGMVWDHYYYGHAVVDALSDVGLSGVVAPTLQDLGGPGAEMSSRHLEETAAIAQDKRLGERGIFAAVGPHATDTVSERLWGEALALAGRHDLPVHLHVAQSIEEVQRSYARHGVSPIGLLERVGALAQAPSMLLVHNIFASNEDLARLDPARHTLVWCPQAQEIFDFPADAWAWERAGLSWVVGTDAVASNDSRNLQKELRRVAGLRSAGHPSSPAHQRFMAAGGLEAAQESEAVRRALEEERGGEAMEERLLSRVWRRPGALHPAARAGVLATGALAHVAVWELDHPSMWPGVRPLRTLAMGDTTGALHNIMIAGRWRGEHGALAASVTESEVYREACEEARRRLDGLLSRM